MAVHSIKSVQKIPVPLAEAWRFFSSPANLPLITPPGLGFRILSKDPGNKIYPGQLIEYKVCPLMRLPVYWMTEITQVEDEKCFVDEQRKGPYRLWRHEHYFREMEGGVEMTDHVSYQVPLGLLGEIANELVVKNKLKQIFTFRFQKIEQLFGSWKEQEMNIIIK